VKNTDVLMVDGMSIMSKRFMESLTEVCSLTRDIFGGILLILF
jgi:hypothetical protein